MGREGKHKKKKKKKARSVSQTGQAGDEMTPNARVVFEYHIWLRLCDGCSAQGIFFWTYVLCVCMYVICI